MLEPFRSFERRRVRYLLIGGQATIVYGASEFTQDLDLWIAGDADNIRRFLRALADVGAWVYKMTPPLTSRYARRGHGFHFQLPGETPPMPLDVMTHPPRVGGFAAARRRASVRETGWGAIPVADPRDLALLKLTNRPGDYEILSVLAMQTLGQVQKPSKRLVRWAADYAFRADDLAEIVRLHGDKLAAGDGAAPAATRRLLAARKSGREASPADLMFAEQELLRSMARFIAAGRAHWTPRIEELRRLRAEGGFWPNGVLVKDLM